MKSTDLKSFHYLENGEITYSMLDTIKSEKKLDAGKYKLHYEGYPVNKVIINQDTDTESVKIHAFPDKDKLDNLLKSFYDPKVINTIKVLGFNHKTGVLFYGSEGTGKSTIIKYYANQCIKEQSALIFYITSNFCHSQCWDFIMKIREVQDNPIVVIYEEFDEYIKDYEGFLKTAFDGNMSINNCIVFASTNYIHAIPDALKNRPSRFKYSLNIEGISEQDDVYNIMHPLLKSIFSDEEIKKFAKSHTNQSLDTIKQFCVDKIMELETYAKKTSLLGFMSKS